MTFYYITCVLQTNVPNKIEIKVRRESILEDSFRIISSVTKTDLLKTKLWIEFEGEAGMFYFLIAYKFLIDLNVFFKVLIMVV